MVQHAVSRYSDDELSEFRALIEQKLSKAQRELNFYSAQLRDLSMNPDSKIKGLDDGALVGENELISSMAARQEKYIQHLENALVRIQNKLYGICRATGELIPKERLRAVPHATLSIGAKKKSPF
jgi:RNA polymerase-binding transcription factor DksA